MERYRSGRNGVDSKSICPVNSGARGFESHPLRQILHSKIWRDLANLFYKLADPPYFLAGNSALDCVVPRFGSPFSIETPHPKVGILYFF